MSIEEILKIIENHPEAIIKSIEKKPELLASLILKIFPFNRIATKEDIKMILDFMEKRFNDINRRFEDVNKRFENIDNRFGDVNRRFEDINKRFEDMNKRFEDIRYYIDKRVGLIERIMIGFNIPILLSIITILIKLFIF
jgi:hypothetical protein